jgi:opacity protein-like surface antigen
MTDSNRSIRFAPRFAGNASIVRSAARVAALTGIALALGISGVPNVLAQTANPQAAGPGSFYAFGGFAALAPQKNSGLNDKGGLGLMAGGGFRTSPRLAVELAFVLSAHEVDTPASATPPAGTFAAGTEESTMGTAGLAATARYNFTTGRFVPYAGGGIGFYRTGFSTTTEATGCVRNCRDTGPRVSEHSNDLGYHIMFGGDFHVTQKDVVGVELRYLKLDAKFGDVVPGKTNAGGAFLWLGYRRIF